MYKVRRAKKFTQEFVVNTDWAFHTPVGDLISQSQRSSDQSVVRITIDTFNINIGMKSANEIGDFEGFVLLQVMSELINEFIKSVGSSAGEYKQSFGKRVGPGQLAILH